MAIVSMELEHFPSCAPPPPPPELILILQHPAKPETLGALGFRVWGFGFRGKHPQMDDAHNSTIQGRVSIRGNIPI